MHLNGVAFPSQLLFVSLMNSWSPIILAIKYCAEKLLEIHFLHLKVKCNGANWMDRDKSSLWDISHGSII